MKINSFMRLSRIALIVMCMAVFGFATYAQAQNATETAENTAPKQLTTQAVQQQQEYAGFNEGAKYIAIAIIMACGSLAAALAVGKIGVAAMGAAAEKPELLGKAIAFVGLGEGIALFGFLISLFLLNK